MHERVREITGFTCRWLVLGLAGAAVLVGSWAGLRAAGPVAACLGADVVPTDILCRQSRRRAAYLMLHHVDSPARYGAAHVLVCLPDGTQLVDGRWRKDISGVAIRRAWAGRIEVQTIGLPYGPVAFSRGRSVVVIAPPGRKEFLVDGRMPLSAAGPKTDLWQRCLKLMTRGGRTAILFVGSAQDYPAARTELRRMGPGIPVEYAGPDDSAAYRRLHVIADALNPSRAKAQTRPTFVTGGRDLAVAAGRKGFPTHLIGRADRPIAGARGVLQHVSLSEFARWLAPESPRAAGGGRS